MKSVDLISLHGIMARLAEFRQAVVLRDAPIVLRNLNVP